MLAGMENAKRKAYVSAEFIKLQHGKENGMNKAIGFTERIKFAVGVALLAALTGCVGYVGPDGGVVVSGPDVVVDPGPVWIGGVWVGRDHHWEGREAVHGYSHRGAESRGFAHSGGHGGRSGQQSALSGKPGGRQAMSARVISTPPVHLATRL